MLNAQNPDCGELSFSTITIEDNGDYSVEVYLRKSDGSNIDAIEQIDITVEITTQSGVPILEGLSDNEPGRNESTGTLRFY